MSENKNLTDQSQYGFLNINKTIINSIDEKTISKLAKASASEVVKQLDSTTTNADIVDKVESLISTKISALSLEIKDLTNCFSTDDIKNKINSNFNNLTNDTDLVKDLVHEIKSLKKQNQNLEETVNELGKRYVKQIDTNTNAIKNKLDEIENILKSNSVDNQFDENDIIIPNISETDENYNTNKHEAHLNNTENANTSIDDKEDNVVKEKTISNPYHSDLEETFTCHISKESFMIRSIEENEKEDWRTITFLLIGMAATFILACGLLMYVIAEVYWFLSAVLPLFIASLIFGIRIIRHNTHVSSNYFYEKDYEKLVCVIEDNNSMIKDYRIRYNNEIIKIILVILFFLILLSGIGVMLFFGVMFSVLDSASASPFVIGSGGGLIITACSIFIFFKHGCYKINKEYLKDESRIKYAENLH